MNALVFLARVVRVAAAGEQQGSCASGCFFPSPVAALVCRGRGSIFKCLVPLLFYSKCIKSTGVTVKFQSKALSALAARVACVLCATCGSGRTFRHGVEFVTGQVI